MKNKKKVMIIDDDKNIRMTLKKALTKGDFKVETAKNGEKALEKLKKKEFPVILLDMKLPGKDGIEVLKEINELDYPCKVIMITGYGSIDSAVETMKLGAVDYLRKPFKPEEITNLVNKVFARFDLEKKENKAESYDDFINMAKSEINKRNFEKAIELLNEATSFNTENPEPFNLLGIIYELKGTQGKAMKMYRTALSLDPTYTPANENLQRASGMDTGKQGNLNELNLGETDEKD